MCTPKKKGGLAIRNLERFNVSLLCKQWWNLESREGLWQKIVRKKNDGGIYQLHSTVNDSPCWADLIKMKDVYIIGRKMKVDDGKQTDFW